MQKYMVVLGDKIRATRYKGQLKDCRRYYELAIHETPLPIEPKRWIIAGAVFIGGCLGAAITWGVMVIR